MKNIYIKIIPLGFVLFIGVMTTRVDAFLHDSEVPSQTQQKREAEEEHRRRMAEEAAENAARDARNAQIAAENQRKIDEVKKRVSGEYANLIKDVESKVGELKSEWVEKISELDKEVLADDLIEAIKLELDDYIENHPKLQALPENEPKEADELEPSKENTIKSSRSMPEQTKLEPLKMQRHVQPFGLFFWMNGGSNFQQLREAYAEEDAAYEAIPIVSNFVNHIFYFRKLEFHHSLESFSARARDNPGVEAIVKMLKLKIDRKINDRSKKIPI